MPISSGASFGVYRITAPLGAGGMGEVYRARDTRLGRDVALKFLPAELAGDRRRLQRFEQEARSASSLNHPNIVTIHEIGHADGHAYIAMELVEGKTLRQLLAPGELPVRKLLELGAQAADGLAKAHAAGIVHRDLKPENLMVTGDGLLKILDFGLAKATAVAGSDSPQLPTIGLSTEEGSLPGTAAYMSPEQASGLELDFRSDQFAFGAVLYEMATGRRAFQAPTSAQTMAVIIQDEPPPIATLNPKVPAPVRWLIERCLDKQRERRYASTADLARELALLRDRLSEVSTAASSAPIPARRRRWSRSALAAAFVAAFALGAGLTWPFARRTIAGPGHPFEGGRFRPFATDPATEAPSAWSPDGKTLLYVRVVAGVLQVFVQNLSSTMGTQITHMAKGCVRPFWHPDGNRIYCASQGDDPEFDLYEVGVAGGAPRLVVENVGSGTLSRDGKVLAFARGEGEIWVSSPPGATPSRVALRGRAEFQGLTDLRFSPDGRRLAVFANDASGRRLSLVTYPGGDVRAVPWTPPEFALTCAWHPDNRHVVVGGPFEVPGQLWLVDTLDGKAWPLTAGPGAARFGATVSPDGLRLAFSTVTEDQDLVEVRFDGPVIRPLLATALKEYDPTWAPDGSRLALVSTRGGAPEIWLRSAQEGWDRPLISVADFDRRALFLGTPSFSPDGRWIAFSAAMSLGEESIWVSSSNGGPAVELAEGKALGSLPTWSPDSRWIAYAEKFVIGKSWLLRKAAVGGAEPPQEIAELSTQEDHAPQWSPSGDWIAYLAPGGLALVSPDGRQQRVLLPGGSLNPFGWSRDGRTLYGLRLDQDHHSLLVAVDVASSRARTLGDLGPAERYSGFSLSPDGNGFATAVKRAPGDIWILEMPSSRPDATTPHS